MIMKFNSCCNRCLNINQLPYLQVQNTSPVYISFVLEYNVGSTGITKRSPVFGPGQIQRLSFPLDCTHLYFEVFNHYYHPPVLICRHDIIAYAPTFYQVLINLGNLQCIQTA